MIRILTVLVGLGLAGCGVDGEPTQPTADLSIGIGDSGVHTAARVGVRKGPFSVKWGVF
ncbi:MAG: hypothetical protein AAF729_03065 [Pseudomonadota bacterium]